ncbi:MAG: hypothetical protein WC140_01865 [Bacteroidales bacterium]
MKFKEIIDSSCGLRYCFESLPLMSGYSRHYMLETEMYTTEKDIKFHQDKVREYSEFVQKYENKNLLCSLQHQLSAIKDIHETIENLSLEKTLDDIELFEIKNLALLSSKISRILAKHYINCDISASIEEVINILDPDGNRISTFYVYDRYSKELAQIRQHIRCTKDEDTILKLTIESQELEIHIREKICKSLLKYSKMLKETLEAMVLVDIYLAKSVMNRDLNLNFPTISQSDNILKSMFNPLIKSLLKEKGKDFQNIDISFNDKPVLIIGSNMGGKTVVLKTVILCQYLFQFGFGLPVKEAEVSIRKDIFFCAGDGQDEKEGISSFGSEMKRIDEVIRCQTNGKDILALIDEPARSTNPIEGTALVSSLIKILYKKNISLLMTTHYNIESKDCQRLKVKGLENGKMNYSLRPSPSGEVPQEALNVATNMGISKEWIAEAKKILNN